MEVELEQLGENITEKGGESLFETNSYFKKIPIIPTHKIKVFLNSLEGGDPRRSVERCISHLFSLFSRRKRRPQPRRVGDLLKYKKHLI